MDYWLSINELCDDCGECDTGYCACLVAEERASIRGITTEEWLSESRSECVQVNLERHRRQLLRIVRKGIIAWQRIVSLHRLISFWRKAAASPDSKAFQSAAKRFKTMAETELVTQRVKN